MTQVAKWLRDADPVAHEAGLSADDAQRMRRAVVAAARERHVVTLWPQPFTIAGWSTPLMMCPACWNAAQLMTPPTFEPCSASWSYWSVS